MSRRIKRLLGRIGFYLLLAAIVFYTVFPFYWAIVSSLKSGSQLFQVDLWPSDPAWDNYVAVFREQPFGRNILNSIFVAVSTVILSLALAVLASYALGRIRFRGRMRRAATSPPTAASSRPARPAPPRRSPVR